ncbi:18741_t:CDS:10, partial [Acaulospora morrowiae]
MPDERLMRYEKLYRKFSPAHSCPMYNTQDSKNMSDSVDLVQRFDAAFKTLFHNKPDGEILKLQEIFLDLSVAQKSLIHTRLKEALEQVVSRMKPSLSNILETPEESLLEVVVSQWMMLCEQLILVKNYIELMDSAVVALGKASIWDIGTLAFRKRTACNVEFNRRLIESMILQIRKFRDGDGVNLTSFRNAIKMFKDLKLYVVMEKILLLESSKYYENRAKSLLLTGSVHEYISRVRQNLKFEEEQLSIYFHPKTQGPLLKVVRSELIDKNAHVIWNMFEKSFVTDNVMHSDNKFRGQALKSLYYFLSNMESIELLQLLIGSYYEQKGNLAYMENTHDWYGLVDSLIQLRSEIDTIVDGGSEDENSIFKIKETWHGRIGKFVSENVTIIELIAKMVNDFMRSPELNPEVWQRFGQSLSNFLSCMEDKTIFRVLYISDLVKRLIFNETSGLEYERQLGKILFAWMEPGFSEKLNVMLEDIAISQKLNNEFKKSYSAKEDLEVFINVLTLNSWPNYMTKFDSPIKLPLNPSFHVITNTDEFYINENLIVDNKHNNYPITIYDVEINRKFKEVQEVRITRQIAEYRTIQLESLIMKIMKPEKTVKTKDLVDRILKHPRFDWATAKDVLDQIQKLRVNEYLKQDEKDSA